MIERRSVRMLAMLGVVLLLSACNAPLDLTWLPFPPIGPDPDPRSEAGAITPPTICPNPLVVNTTEDVSDGVCNEEHCSFPDAVQASNTCVERQTIQVPAGDYQLLTPIQLEDAVNIEGAGMADSIMEIDSCWRVGATNVSLSGLQFVELRGDELGEGDTACALHVDEGAQLQLSASWIQRGWVGSNTQIHDTYWGSAAIMNEGDLEVQDSVIELAVGGDDLQSGIWHLGDRLTVEGSEFPRSGLIAEGAFTVSDTNFDESFLTMWACDSGRSLVERSTLSGGEGGVNLWAGTPITFRNSTISGIESDAVSLNTRLACPLVEGAGVRLEHVTIADNQVGIGGRGPVEIRGSIIADNLDQDCNITEGEGIVSEGYNLDSDGSCDLTEEGDQSGVDPLILPLGDHGGRTLTHAPRSDSPAVDAVVDGCPPPESDQRGQARPAGDGCDVGSVELVGAERDIGTGTPDPTPLSGAIDVNFNADLYTIERGQCTTLRWRVSGASSISLLGQEVEATGADEVCPDETTGYTLLAQNDADEASEYLEIAVTEPTDDGPVMGCTGYNQNGQLICKETCGPNDPGEPCEL